MGLLNTLSVISYLSLSRPEHFYECESVERSNVTGEDPCRVREGGGVGGGGGEGHTQGYKFSDTCAQHSNCTCT